MLIKFLSQGLCLEAVYVGCSFNCIIFVFRSVTHRYQIYSNPLLLSKKHWPKHFYEAVLAIAQTYYIRAVQLLTKTAEHLHQAHNNLQTYISSLSPSRTPLSLKRNVSIFPDDGAITYYCTKPKNCSCSTVAHKAANQAFER